jgi:hypothetical protein
MKYKLLLLIITGTYLSSCVFSDSQKIRTKDETINALIGSWKPKNSSSNTSSINFIDKTHYVVFYHVKGGDLAQLNGTWSCENTGIAHLNIGNKLNTITIINNKEMIMSKSEAFEKQ